MSIPSDEESAPTPPTGPVPSGPSPKIEGEGLEASVRRALDDALVLVEYLSLRSTVGVTFDAILAVPPEKIASDPNLAGRLYEFLERLKRFAAPATPDGIRIAAAMAGKEGAKPPI